MPTASCGRSSRAPDQAWGWRAQERLAGVLVDAACMGLYHFLGEKGVISRSLGAPRVASRRNDAFS